jgi:hypothetical protein
VYRKHIDCGQGGGGPSVRLAFSTVSGIRADTASVVLGCVGEGRIRIEGKPQIIRTLVLSEQNEYFSVGWVLCSYNTILNNDIGTAVVSVNVAKRSRLKYKQDIKNKLRQSNVKSLQRKLHAHVILTLLCIISCTVSSLETTCALSVRWRRHMHCHFAV